MTFEPNAGQADARVAFVGRGKGLTVFLTAQEIAFQVANPQGARPNGTSVGTRLAQEHSAQGGMIELHLQGVEHFSWKGEDKLRAESNYFLGHDPRQWRTEVPHFARVASCATHGVGMSVYGNDDGVEYDLRVAPGGDASKLRLGITGADSIRLTSNGDLILRAGIREMRMKKPEIYEELSSNEVCTVGEQGEEKAALDPAADCRADRKRKSIAGAFVMEADGSVGFRVGPHDKRATLVIDPSLSIVYATFLGGTGSDSAASLAIDATGKIYVGGTTNSASTFPESSNPPIGPVGSSTEFFIAKIDPAVSGPNSLIYLTFLGGSGTQTGGLVAVDSHGNAAITGTTTSSDFPVTDSSQPTGGLNNTTVSEIDPVGNTLIFSTLLMGAGNQSKNSAGGIAVDATGNIYVASDTNSSSGSMSPGLPTTPGAFQPAWGAGNSDGFLAIFQPPAQPGGAGLLTYCSYLGTNSVGPAGVGGVALDALGNVYITGFTSNNIAGSFPVVNAIQIAYGGGASDAFLMKIMPASQGTADIQYATLLGGADADEALGVAVDSAAPVRAYITGTTQSKNFPVTSSGPNTVAAYQPLLRQNATSNSFLAVLTQNPTTSATSLVYSTYFGGAATDSGQGVAVAATLNGLPGPAYIVGTTNSADLPWRDDLQAFNGTSDVFIAKFDPTASGSASLLFATPLAGTPPPGGTANASGSAIAVDNAGHVYVAGQTTAADFPTAITTQGPTNGFQQTCAGCQQPIPAGNAFVAGISESAVQKPSVYFNIAKINFPATTIGAQNTLQLVGILNGGEAPLTISNLGITGTNARDFPLVIAPGACVGAVNPGQATTCTFEVGFIPSVVGPEVAVITVADNAPGSPQILELEGTGKGPLASISPASASFGNQPENTTSNAQTITLTNAGDQTLTLANINFSGVDEVQFHQEAGGSCFQGIALMQGNSCTLILDFAPSAIGSFHAEIDFLDNSAGVANAKHVVPLTGTGTAPTPIVSIIPASLAIAFASTSAGSASGGQIVTLKNSGSAPLSLTSIALTGANASDFAIVSAGTTCPLGSGSLNFGQPVPGCTVLVQFTPLSGGVKNASLSFIDNGAGSPQQVALSGTGIIASTLLISPSALPTFAPQSEGTTSSAQSITISNMGTAAASMPVVSVTPATETEFVVQSSCGPVIAANANCPLSVLFRPLPSTLPGSRAATLNVPGAIPSTIPLAGIATQASISIAPSSTSINFGSRPEGGSGTAVTVTATNNSSGPLAGALAFSGVQVTGANSGDFALGANACSAMAIPPSAACTMQITFSPACVAAPATRTATLLLTDNAPVASQSIPLSGTATGDFCFAFVPATTIAAGQVATYALNIFSADNFSGTVSLACSGAPVSATCTFTPTGTTTVPGQIAVTVTTTPASGMLLRGLRIDPRLHLPIAIVALSLMSAFFVACLLGNWAAGSYQHGRRWLRLAQAAALVAALACGMAACSGGGGSGSDQVVPTPAGTYTLTITGTATNGTTQTMLLGLTVR